ncbi:helicase-associated domain-containing protein [Microbacterium neungamense]|uniref:helicase-associated domain-containing protein n=1 Tax=Microbacterium neungamense TaxID=2810535 RepID=UPI00217DF275|nr:helicase-associated domain-containing protein [Microbacterium neungamense]UWF77040.1 helicase-associated domain-containing protein [Microbacterium neungamense]
MSTYARPLADRLAAADDAWLAELFHARGVRADAPWQDFFDAAEALLDTASVERALCTLTRDEAEALVRAARDGSAGDPSPGLRALALMDDDGRVPPPVAAIAEQRDVPPAPVAAEAAPASAEAAARAAERAFQTVRGLADLLLSARTAPLTLVASGALGAGERRRLAEGGMDAEVLDELRALAVTADLARPVDRELRITPAAGDWLDSPFRRRWALLAEAFRESLPRGIRTGAGWIPVAAWDDAHPWDPGWPAAVAALRNRAALLGLSADDGGEPAWATPLRRGEPADAEPLATLLPSEVDRVFLQNDLTAIAPGPLLPALDNRLRAMTEHDAAQASSYRFTAESIARALADGETGQSILDFLTGLSPTGLPQPLSYLVAQTAQRHGLVRVTADPARGTVVSSTDAHLLQAIEVDRALRPLGLVRDGEVLVSRVGADTIAWALADARYPATLVGGDGAAIPPARRRMADEHPAAAASYAPLIARLRAHQGPDADAAWLDRELEAAVRARAVVLVEVAMPDGSSRELALEASGLGGGRLRGRDRTADVERTLPVRSIRSVRVLEG